MISKKYNIAYTYNIMKKSSGFANGVKFAFYVALFLCAD